MRACVCSFVLPSHYNKVSFSFTSSLVMDIVKQTPAFCECIFERLLCARRYLSHKVVNLISNA